MPCSPVLGYWTLRLPEPWEEPHGAVRISGGVPPQGARPGGAGRPVAEVAKALGISDQTIYTWRRQDRIDKGLEPG